MKLTDLFGISSESSKNLVLTNSEAEILLSIPFEGAIVYDLPMLTSSVPSRVNEVLNLLKTKNILTIGNDIVELTDVGKRAKRFLTNPRFFIRRDFKVLVTPGETVASL